MTVAVSSGAIEVVVLAGGKGTRLLPYTAVLPKPLMPLGDMPILELVLRQLRAQGFKRVLLAVNHLHHLVQSFFGDGSRLGLAIQYSVEDEPMGTAAPLAPILDQLERDFLVLNGDLLTTFSFHALMSAHKERGADLTVATHLRTFQVEFGVLSVAAASRIKSVAEKPSIDHWIAMGIYAANREALRPLLPVGQFVDMPTIIHNLIAAKGSVVAHHQDCTWLDIGRPEDYSMAQSMFESKRHVFLPH